MVHPCRLPEGWQATSNSFARGTPPKWGLGFVTDDEEFVGLRQEQTDVGDLLETYVDKSADQGQDADPANDLGVTSWQTWSDSGGDHAFSTTLAAPLDGPDPAGLRLRVGGGAGGADRAAQDRASRVLLMRAS